MKAIAGMMLVLLASTAAPCWAQTGQPTPLLPAPPPSKPAAEPDNTTLRTTTDTPAYCQQLQGQVHDQMRDNKEAADDEVRHLSREGERLCANGQTRSGIQHLRNAYRIMRVPAARTGR
jgi:hypothetical protein